MPFLGPGIVFKYERGRVDLKQSDIVVMTYLKINLYLCTFVVIAYLLTIIT